MDSKQLIRQYQPSPAGLVVVGFVLVAITVVLVQGMRSRGGRRVRAIDPASGYTNTRRDVPYVGDQACARCHAEIVESYKQHPMGQSLARAVPGRLPGGARTFIHDGFAYRVEVHGDRVLHTERRLAAASSAAFLATQEVHYVLGSGRRGFAFLVARDHELYQSPISWYTQRGAWGLSPGYERQNAHFDRPVTSSCLYCHANRTHHLAGSVNRYQDPVFDGMAIGCERCHGPGGDHLANPWIVGERDVTIVNPARLEPGLRDGVCQQCHLSGRRRIPHQGRRDEDYRPGLPFEQFWTVLEPPGAATSRFVGQVEQLRESRCSIASQGRLWCVSCHDPHQVPAATERAAYYRDRCLTCHARQGCALAPAARDARNNDCVACHMPRQGNEDVIHAATTNHRIPRQAQALPPADTNPTQPPTTLVPFHPSLQAEPEQLGRDLAVATCRDSVEAAAQAEQALARSLALHPDDPAAWEARALALETLGRPRDAVTAWKTALTLSPQSETAIAGLASATLAAGDIQQAVELGQRAVALAPARAEYHALLAQALFQARNWPHAAEHAQHTLRLNPANLETRHLLIRTLLRLGNRSAARTQLQRLIDFDPTRRSELLTHFAGLIQSQP